MVSLAPLALRFPKQLVVFQHSNGVSTEVIDTVTHLKHPQHYGMPVAPRLFGNEVAKVEFHACVRNTGGSDITGARLKIWPASAPGISTQPDIAIIAPQSGTTQAEHTISSIINRLFNTEGAKINIPPQGGGEESVLRVTFDAFTASDSDFFTAFNLPDTDTEYIQLNVAIAIDSGSTSAIITAFGMTVTSAPSQTNDTVTYHQLWTNQRETAASGPSEFDSAKTGAPSGCSGSVSNQFRGAFRWRYIADDWDEISAVHLLILYGSGSNGTGQTYRLCKLTSEVQGGGSTTVEFSELFNPGSQSHGYYRTQDFFPGLVDGDELCFDFRNEVAAVGSGGTTPNVCAILEIVQKGCNKTVTYFHAEPSATRASTGMLFTDAIPNIFGNNGLIDPLWFRNYPNDLLTKRQGIGQMTHEVPAFNPEMQILANSNLVEEQNGPGGSTPTTQIIFQHNCTPCSEVPRWKYQALDLDENLDPLNFAGPRKLIARIANPPVVGATGCDTHPGQMSLAYSYSVPEREVLELGPVLPVGAFSPEGCAATSAGLGDPGVLVITNGETIPKKFDPVANKIEDNGIPLPFEGEFPPQITIDNAAASPEGGIQPGAYEYRYTFRNCCTGKESDPNPDTFTVDSSSATPFAQHNINFAGVRIPADPQICEICIYRTLESGNFPIMAKVGCFDPDVTTVFVDTIPDSLLDFQADPLALLNAPMPCVPVVVEYRNRLFGLGDIPQLTPAGTVSVIPGSKIVTGDEDVLWDRCLEGKFIQITGDCRTYEIERILPPAAGTSPDIGRIKLVEEYEGTIGTGLKYIFCGHNNRLFFSEPLEPECWPNINFLDIEPGDGDKLIGGASNFDSLVICKRNKTYILRFRENPLLEVVVPTRISTDIGSIGPRSFAQFENGTVWLSDRGLAMFDGRGVQHIPESDRFNDMLINPENPNYVRRDGQGRVIDAVGVFYPKREQYLLLLPTVKTVRGANVMLVWDTSLQNITLYEFCQEFQSMVVAKDSDGNQRVYLGDTNGFVWIFDVGDTDGVGFPGATGTVRGIVGAAGVEAGTGASFFDDAGASFIVGGLPQLAGLSGAEGLTPSFDGGDLGLAGACVFTRAAGATPNTPFVERLAYAATDTRVYVTPGWGTETPAVGDEYMIGPIEFVAQFKPSNYGTDDMIKRNWEEVLSFIPEEVSTQLRVELLDDFASSDPEEFTATGDPNGRVFDLSFSRGRLTKPVGRRLHNFMQVRMSNFAPDEPVRVLNHLLRSTPRRQ